MATALRPFKLLQAGIETTKGTLVAATRQLPGDHGFTEEQDFYRSPFPAGVRSNVGGAGVIIRKGYAIDYSSDLTAEDILWMLETGVKGGISPSTVDINAKLWTYTPELTTGVPTIKTATFEMIHADGVTNHYAGEVGYGMCESFKIDWAFNQEAKFSAKFFARARQTTTPTGALTPYASREPLVSNLVFVYLDTTWAGLGGTQLQTIIRSGSIEIMTGYAPNYTLDGRSDKDFVNHKVGIITGKLSLVMELDATAASRIANYRANDVVYIRVRNEGSLIGSVSAKKFVQIDGAYRFVSAPAFSEDGQQILVSLDLESVYDSTGTKTLEFSAQNLLAVI